MKEFFSGSALKFILILKVVAISSFVLYQTKIISFGEKKITAQEAQPEKPADPKVESNDEESPVDAKTGNSENLINSLLSLPSINSEVIKKDELGRYLKLIERKKNHNGIH